MNKTNLLFLFELGLAVMGFALFSYMVRKNRENPSGFRDDIWDKTPAGKRKQEDKVDQKIRLEHMPLSSDEPEEKPKAQTPPNFRGKPHQVLGVGPQASEQEILSAYRYWIKRYHPDRVTHLGAKYVEQARRRAEQLNAARDFLVKKKN